MASACGIVRVVRLPNWLMQKIMNWDWFKDLRIRQCITLRPEDRCAAAAVQAIVSARHVTGTEDRCAGFGRAWTS